MAAPLDALPHRIGLDAPTEPRAPAPEVAARLIGHGFRNLTIGLRNSDLTCFERAWTEYAAELGPERGAVALAGLSAWVRAIATSSCRSIEVAPIGCERMCRDECMAVSIIAACQHSHCPALHACIHALIDSAFVGPVAEQSRSFADRLREINVVMAPDGVIERTLDPMLPACARIH